MNNELAQLLEELADCVYGFGNGVPNDDLKARIVKALDDHETRNATAGRATARPYPAE